MPFSFWHTYIFPIETIGSNNLQLILRFNNDDTNETYNPENLGIHILDYGALIWEYDFDEPLLVPGTLRMTLLDKNNHFEGRFFPSPATEVNLDPAAEIQLYVNNVLEFVGRVIVDTVRFDMGTKVLTFEIAPQMDIINKKMIYDIDGNYTNPFSYNISTYYKFTKYIEDIFKLVDTTISYPSSLIVTHSWLFGGYRNGFPGTRKEDFKLTDLYWHPEIYYMTNPSPLGIKTAGDILRAYAFVMGSYCGMITNKRAFFKELFVYNSANTQTLGEVIDRQIVNEFNTIDYYRCILRTGSTFDGQEHEAGTETSLEGKYEVKDIFGFFSTDGTEPPSLTWTNTQAIFSGNTYWIDGVESTIVGGGQRVSLGDLTANFWYNFRSRYSRMVMEHFTVLGTAYSYEKDFTYDSQKYQIIRLEKIYSENITRIKALRIPD